MKKINFLLGTMLLASTSVLTSCFSNEIPEIVINGSAGGGSMTDDGVKLGEILPSENYTYTIVCNVSANIYINGARVASSSQYTGKGGIGEKITIKATTTTPGYTTDEITKIVTLDSNGKVIRFNFAKNPTSATKEDKMPYAVSVEDAKEMTDASSASFVSDPIVVENTKTNKKEPYPGTTTDVKMTLWGETVIKALNSGVDPKALFTITARDAVMTGIDQNNNEGKEWFPVLTLTCTPDGAQFGDKPAVVNAANPYFEKGMSFRCLGAVQDAAKLAPNGGSVEIKLSHFSDYIVESEVNVKKVGESEVRTQTLLDCKIGNHKYPYFVYSGCDYDYRSNGFMNKYLEAKFGPKTYSAKGEITISNLSSRATVPYTVVQKVFKYVVSFGDIDVNVDVYGPEDVFVDTDNSVIYDATKHSGGSAY